MILQTDYKLFDTAPKIDINRSLPALINKLEATVCEICFGLIYGGLLLCYSGLDESFWVLVVVVVVMVMVFWWWSLFVVMVVVVVVDGGW